MTPEYLPVFFGPGNDLRHNDLVSGRWGEHAAALEPWIERLVSGMPTLLPRRQNEDLDWYGLATSAAEVEELRALVLAWVGPSYSDFTGRPPVALDDSFDISVAEHTAGNWFKFRVANGSRESVREALDRMRRLTESRPGRVDRLRHPLGRLLRDFDWSLNQGDPERSFELLRAIQTSGQMSAMNISYLKVRRLSALDLGDELLALPDLPDVVASRRPTAVTSAIVEALHTRFIEDPAAAGNTNEAITVFRDQVVSRYGGLFAGLTPKPALGELRLQLLRAVLEPQKPELRDEVLAAAVHLGIDDSFLADIANLIPDRIHASTGLDAVRQALDNGAFAQGLSQLQDISDGRQHVELAIRVALELDQPAAAGFALQRLEALPQGDRSGLEKSPLYGRPIEHLRALATGPESWLELIRTIANNQATAIDIEQARNRWGGWSVDALREEASTVERLLLGQRTPHADVLLRSVLPELVESLIAQPIAPQDQPVRSILTAIFYVLRLADGRSPGDLESLIDLTDHLIASASAEEYRQLVSDVIDVWEEEESAKRLPWLIDVAEIIAGHPQRNPGTTAAFATVFETVVRRRRHQMTEFQLEIAVRVLEELDIDSGGLIPEAIAQATSEIRGLAAVPPLKVGLYTLTPGVGERVVRVLSERAPALDVRVNSDTHSTDQLVSLAREADIFIVVTRSATHSATDAIRGARPADLPLLYASGKGSTSVLAVLAELFPGLGLATE